LAGTVAFAAPGAAAAVVEMTSIPPVIDSDTLDLSTRRTRLMKTYKPLTAQQVRDIAKAHGILRAANTVHEYAGRLGYGAMKPAFDEIDRLLDEFDSTDKE